MITVQFMDFNEMVAFAKVLLNGYQPAPVNDKKVEKAPVEKKENVAKEQVDIEKELVKTYTLEEVRAELAKLTRAGKQKEVKELLTSFGAKNLSSVDPKDYAALMEKAGEL